MALPVPLPVFSMSRIDRIYRSYTITATTSTGAPATLTGVDFALVPPDAIGPGTGTTWVAGTSVGGQWRVLLAGPDADQTGAIAVPAWGGDLYARVTDTPEVIAELVERITVP